jgi:hypothetical protein
MYCSYYSNTRGVTTFRIQEIYYNFIHLLDMLVHEIGVL